MNRISFCWEKVNQLRFIGDLLRFCAGLKLRADPIKYSGAGGVGIKSPAVAVLIDFGKFRRRGLEAFLAYPWYDAILANILNPNASRLDLRQPFHRVNRRGQCQELRSEVFGTLRVRHNLRRLQPIGPIAPRRQNIECRDARISCRSENRNRATRTLSEHSYAIHIKVTARSKIIQNHQYVVDRANE